MRSAARRRAGNHVMAAVRLMAFFRDVGHPRLARATSHLVRALYGSEIHWDAHWAPGVTLMRGSGLTIGRAATIGPDCVLYENVHLVPSADTGAPIFGAPTLGRGVHVGPGATLLGPIAVGDGSRVMSGTVLWTSVPAGSLVTPPRPQVLPRVRNAPWGARDLRARSYPAAGR